MNCREGDLAIVVKSFAGNEGKIVRCIKFVGTSPENKIRTDFWEIDQMLMTTKGYRLNFAGDSQLRPIRDSDKQDEMLSIVNLKEKVKS